MPLKNYFSVFMRGASKFKPILVTLLYYPFLTILYVIIGSWAILLPEKDQGIVQSFIEWFGTAYSLFLALVLVNAWTQHDTVDQEFDRELDAVVTLYQTSKYVQSIKQRKDNKGNIINQIISFFRYGIKYYETSQDNITVQQRKVETEVAYFKDEVKKQIIGYVKHVIENFNLEHVDSPQRYAGDNILEMIGQTISSLTREQIVESSIISELFISLNEARDAREDRISNSKRRVPTTVKIVALIFSAVWLLSFFGLVIETKLLAITLISSVSFVIVVVLVIIFDLDDPFEGTWNIDNEAWVEYLDIIEPKFRVLFVFNQDGTPLEQIRLLLNRKSCALYSLSKSGFFGLPWNKFLKRTFSGKDIKFGIVIANNLNKHVVDESFIKNNEPPFVLLIRGINSQILLNKQEISTCPDIKTFEGIFKKKIKEYISDF